MLSTFIKLPFSIKTIVLSIYEWPLKTGFTVYMWYPIYVVPLSANAPTVLYNYETCVCAYVMA